ncbi:MAG: cyclohexa-1,5-dienecarbonyl-CoA hydratase, partial [Chlorobi bacterium]|nr:cyclohexa-1,5-dienecarbonyl-CoA hydratase [Chlorobiota bacterium]
LDSIMMEVLNQVFSELKKKPDIKMISFVGEGKHFSFGASVEEHTKENAARMLKNFHQMFYNIIDLSVPTLSKISGQCLGGGLELALICNFMFADTSAKLGQPEIMLGVFPPPASVLLPLKIGSARAEELLITGKTISANTARDIGLLNYVFESKDELQQETDKWIQKFILPKSASSLRYAVAAARISLNKTVKEKLAELESIYVKKLMETHDANEGINSFLEKRKAEWKNS